MIVFADIMTMLKEHGWTTIRIRKDHIFGGGVMDRIRKHESISTNTVDTICRLCQCQPGDIMKYVEDPDDQKSE